jgi:uncharacterized protein (DUF362 family)
MSQKLDRRRFLWTSAGLIGAGGTALLAGCPKPKPAPTGGAVTPGPAAPTAGAVNGKVGANRLVDHPVPDVQAIIAHGKSRAEMVKAAVEAYGGMGAFVKKGDRVVIKPNLGWAMTPEMGVDTHPEVVAAVVKLCKEAGASEIIMGEHSCDTWVAVKELSGVPEAAEGAGAHVMGWGADERLYDEVDFPAGKSTKSDLVAKDLLECDVLINCPKLKNHSATNICGAMKNQMGAILRPQNYHLIPDPTKGDPNLHVNIADLASAVRPTLNIVDATNCCVSGGPKGGPGAEVKDFDTVIVSADIVACDSLGIEIIGICKLDDVPHVRIAADERKLGSILKTSDAAVKTISV